MMSARNFPFCMITAIVLDSYSSFLASKQAYFMGLVSTMEQARCHHVTLALGKSERFTIGEVRAMRLTHYGETAGRVTAFRVSGAHDSHNDIPHLTIATIGDARPREANDIFEWKPLKRPLDIFGSVAFVE